MSLRRLVRQSACASIVASAIGAHIAFADPAPSGADPAPPKAENGLTWLVVPLPNVDPTIGNGVIPVVGFFYSPVRGGRPWVTGVAGLYTDRHNAALAVAQQADLLDGKLRLQGMAGYGAFRLDFFGVGQSAGARNLSVTLDQTGAVAIGNGVYRIVGAFYAGLRYRYIKLRTGIAEPIESGRSLPEPVQLDSTISGLGPAFEYDTRDDQFLPKKGVYIYGRWTFDTPRLGSEFSYRRMTFAANSYIPEGDRTVIALRASACWSGKGAPFYDLCLFGFDNDLRGYKAGQYRDHAMAAVQGEVRRTLFWRVGMVAFAGVGAVAPEFSELASSRLLPAGGVGLRWRPKKDAPVNVSFDYAWGRDSSAAYLYVGEAF